MMNQNCMSKYVIIVTYCTCIYEDESLALNNMWPMCIVCT